MSAEVTIQNEYELYAVIAYLLPLLIMALSEWALWSMAGFRKLEETVELLSAANLRPKKSVEEFHSVDVIAVGAVISYFEIEKETASHNRLSKIRVGQAMGSLTVVKDFIAHVVSKLRSYGFFLLISVVLGMLYVAGDRALWKAFEKDDALASLSVVFHQFWDFKYLSTAGFIGLGGLIESLRMTNDWLKSYYPS